MKRLPDCFAIVPAAGQSLRMGAQNKLLLPWRGATIIDQVLQAWTQSMVRRVIVVVRSNDVELQAACRNWPTVDLVIPTDNPDDMKQSIQLGLQSIALHFAPHDADRWLVAPADLPTLSSELVNQLIRASRDSESIVVPRFGDRPGHPVSFPWALVPDVFELGSGQGVDQLVSKHPVDWLKLPANRRPQDIDTPTDYARLSDRQKPS